MAFRPGHAHAYVFVWVDGGRARELGIGAPGVCVVPPGSCVPVADVGGGGSAEGAFPGEIGVTLKDLDAFEVEFVVAWYQPCDVGGAGFQAYWTAGG
jgi:hypothetical protein